MAETITQITQPPEFIEAAGKTLFTELQQAVGDFKGADLIKSLWSTICSWTRSFTSTSNKLATGDRCLSTFLTTAATAVKQVPTSLSTIYVSISTRCN